MPSAPFDETLELGSHMTINVKREVRGLLIGMAGFGGDRHVPGYLEAHLGN